MEKLDALYKMAVIRDDAKAIEEIADMALEAGPSSLITVTAALAKDIKISALRYLTCWMTNGRRELCLMQGSCFCEERR